MKARRTAWLTSGAQHPSLLRMHRRLPTPKASDGDDGPLAHGRATGPTERVAPGVKPKSSSTEGEQRRLVDLVASARPLVVVLVGLPGAGKSTFSTHLKQVIAERLDGLVKQCKFRVVCQDELGSRQKCARVTKEALKQVRLPPQLGPFSSARHVVLCSRKHHHLVSITPPHLTPSHLMPCRVAA